MPPPKKKKKNQTWYYVAGAVGLVGAYYLYERRKAKAAAANAANAPAAIPATATAPAAAGSYGNAGDLASLLPYLQGNASQASTQGSSGSSGVASVGPMSGSGFLPPGATAAQVTNNPGTFIASDAQGNTYNWLSPSQSQAYQGPRFFEPIPGVFMPYTIGDTSLLPNTPIYAPASGVTSVSSAGPSTTAGQ